MPVRVGTGSSAVDPSALRVAGVAPSKIMLGTGTSAVEAWSARYVASGSGGARNISARSSWETVTTHNVSGVGEASGQWHVEWQGVTATTNFGVRVLRNGVVLAVNGPRSGLGNFGAAAQSVSIPGTLLASGDQLQFQAYGDHSIQTYRALNSWSWSVS